MSINHKNEVAIKVSCKPIKRSGRLDCTLTISQNDSLYLDYMYSPLNFYYDEYTNILIVPSNKTGIIVYDVAHDTENKKLHRIDSLLKSREVMGIKCKDGLSDSSKAVCLFVGPEVATIKFRCYPDLLRNFLSSLANALNIDNKFQWGKINNDN